MCIDYSGLWAGHYKSLLPDYYVYLSATVDSPTIQHSHGKHLTVTQLLWQTDDESVCDVPDDPTDNLCRHTHTHSCHCLRTSHTYNVWSTQSYQCCFLQQIIISPTFDDIEHSSSNLHCVPTEVIPKFKSHKYNITETYIILTILITIYLTKTVQI